MLRSFALVLLLAAPLWAGETPPRALELNEAGAKLYGRGDYEAAQGRFREAYTLAPEDPTIRRNLAYCLLRLGDQLLLRNDPGRALRDYGEAGSLIPTDWAPRFREGLALFRARRDREAGTTLERALADHPERVDGWELLALVRYRLGENAAAIEAWERALRLDPKNERLRQDLARARRASQRADGAEGRPAPPERNGQQPGDPVCLGRPLLHQAHGRVCRGARPGGEGPAHAVAAHAAG